MKTNLKQNIIEIIRFIVTVAFIVLPIRILVAQPFIVSGESMVPTFHNREYLVIDQLSYLFGHPHRGDVVVFRYPQDTSRFFIKRVIAVPGDSVKIRGTEVTVTTPEHPEGVIINEPYISYPTVSTTDVTLGEKQYFVMGDNRPNSLDSRYWGALDEKYIKGRAFLRLLPFSQASFLPGSHRNKYTELAAPTETAPIETEVTAQ